MAKKSSIDKNVKFKWTHLVAAVVVVVLVILGIFTVNKKLKSQTNSVNTETYDEVVINGESPVEPTVTLQ